MTTIGFLILTIIAVILFICLLASISDESPFLLGVGGILSFMLLILGMAAFTYTEDLLVSPATVEVAHSTYTAVVHVMEKRQILRSVVVSDAALLDVVRKGEYKVVATTEYACYGFAIATSYSVVPK